MIWTFKVGQAQPLYAGPAYLQPGLSSVAAPLAPSVVAGTEVTSPPSTAGLVNEQSTLMRSDPMTSGGWVSSTQIYRHPLCQDLYFKIVRFLLIGGDVICLWIFYQIILYYLKYVT